MIIGEMTPEKESLHRYLLALRASMQKKPYEHWIAQQYPVAYDDDFEGRDVQVEIDLLEMEPAYLHLLITASNSDAGWYDTLDMSVFIRRQQAADEHG